MPAPPVGTHIQEELVLDIATVKAGAALLGDQNPLHHDEAIAARSRYGGIIASGAHTSALLAGLTTRGFRAAMEQDTGAVGVTYRVQFLAPVPVNRRLRMEWTVTALEPKRPGTFARLEGKITDIENDAVLLRADMTMLFFA